MVINNIVMKKNNHQQKRNDTVKRKAMIESFIFQTYWGLKKLYTTPSNSAFAMIKTELECIVELNLFEDLLMIKKFVDNVKSTFSWDGEICEEKEVLMMIKTRRTNYGKIKLVIEDMHSYSVPEIIALPIVDCSEDYLKWLIKETDV